MESESFVFVFSRSSPRISFKQVQAQVQLQKRKHVDRKDKKVLDLEAKLGIFFALAAPFAFLRCCLHLLTSLTHTVPALLLCCLVRALDFVFPPAETRPVYVVSDAAFVWEDTSSWYTSLFTFSQRRPSSISLQSKRQWRGSNCNWV